jgi:hypothetical protein
MPLNIPQYQHNHSTWMVTDAFQLFEYYQRNHSTWIMTLTLNIISCMHNHSTWMVQYAFEYYQHITIQPNSKGLSCITIMVHSRKE